MIIWDRYIFKEIGKIFFLFLFCFYFLYVLIDYTSRANALIGSNFNFYQWIVYYALIFIRRLEILLPFALILACIRTLCQLNLHNELVAMLISGMRLKRLLRPFVFTGLLCTLVMYANIEFAIPRSLQMLKQMEDLCFSEDDITSRKNTSVQQFILEDGSILIYQAYDSARELFFDVYWVRSTDDVYRIKHLFPDAEATVGRFVDHFVRNQNGELDAVESFDAKILSEIRFSEESLAKALYLPEELSISYLWKELPALNLSLSSKETHIVCWFYIKLAMPWLCLLATIAPIPYCIRFSRQHPTFFIYILGVFGLVAFYLIMNASHVLAQGQVLPSYIAVFAPFVLAFATFGRKYFKLA